MKFSIHVIPSLSSFASIVRVQFVPFLHRRLLSSTVRKSWEMETVISGEWQTLNYNLLKIFRMSLLMKRKFCMLWIFGVIFPSLSFCLPLLPSQRDTKSSLNLKCGRVRKSRKLNGIGMDCSRLGSNIVEREETFSAMRKFPALLALMSRTCAGYDSSTRRKSQHNFVCVAERKLETSKWS